MRRSNIIKLSLILLLALASVLMIGCSSDYVMKVGSYKVSQDLYSYFTNNYRAQLSPSLSGDELEDAIIENSENALKEYYAVYELAKSSGYKLSDEDKTVISDTYDAYQDEYGGKEAFEAMIAEGYMTPALMKDMLEMLYIKEQLYGFLTAEFTGNIISDDATVEADIEQNFAHALHILIMNDEGDDTEQNRALAESILSSVNGGEDFLSLVLQYSEDPGQTEDGYYFTKGEMIEAFENAAFALEVGQTSKVVESHLGFHIIKRLPIEAEYVDEHFENFREAYLAREYNKMLIEAAQKLEIEYN